LLPVLLVKEDKGKLARPLECHKIVTVHNRNGQRLKEKKLGRFIKECSNVYWLEKYTWNQTAVGSILKCI